MAVTAGTVIGNPTWHWACPTCRHPNSSEGWNAFAAAVRCEGCKRFWAMCPNEDCYGAGESCPICHGVSLGMVEVTTAKKWWRECERHPDQQCACEDRAIMGLNDSWTLAEEARIAGLDKEPRALQQALENLATQDHDQLRRLATQLKQADGGESWAVGEFLEQLMAANP